MEVRLRMSFLPDLDANNLFKLERRIGSVVDVVYNCSHLNILNRKNEHLNLCATEKIFSLSCVHIGFLIRTRQLSKS